VCEYTHRCSHNWPPSTPTPQHSQALRSPPTRCCCRCRCRATTHHRPTTWCGGGCGGLGWAAAQQVVHKVIDVIHGRGGGSTHGRGVRHRGCCIGCIHRQGVCRTQTQHATIMRSSWWSETFKWKGLVSNTKQGRGGGGRYQKASNGYVRLCGPRHNALCCVPNWRKGERAPCGCVFSHACMHACSLHTCRGDYNGGGCSWNRQRRAARARAHGCISSRCPQAPEHRW
jgi:hypothetical protein